MHIYTQYICFGNQNFPVHGPIVPFPHPATQTALRSSRFPTRDTCLYMYMHRAWLYMHIYIYTPYISMCTCVCILYIYIYKLPRTRTTRRAPAVRHGVPTPLRRRLLLLLRFVPGVPPGWAGRPAGRPAASAASTALSRDMNEDRAHPSRAPVLHDRSVRRVCTTALLHYLPQRRDGNLPQACSSCGSFGAGPGFFFSPPSWRDGAYEMLPINAHTHTHIPCT